MALRSFRVENQKALRLAQSEQVPRVMVIAGPNGVGKSTLLHCLHRKTGALYDDGTQVIYQPPHRAIRRQRVQRRWLGGGLRRLVDIFAGGEVSGFEGLHVPFPARSPDNVDEAGSTIKYTLGKIENRRTTLVTSLVDQHREAGRHLDAATLPNVYEPVERLTSKLLPHLTFRKIDFSDEDNVRCVFERTDGVGTDRLDLDDLSSGEKSILLLFLPLIENEINSLFGRLEAAQVAAVPPVVPDRVFLIDEPEQHLHPDLQVRILGYLREEAARQNIQFVLTTHSSTLVDQAFDTELYVLNFPRQVADNQLRRVSTNIDRLEALKALAGSTYVITTGRSIVCLEGIRDATSKPTDVRLLEILYARATRYTFVPIGGKGNVVRVVLELRENLPEEHFGIKVFGIVDRDRAEPTVAGIVAWPVCNIENLLLDTDAIATAVQDLDQRKTITVEEIRALLVDTAREERDEEIRLRVMDAIGARTVRIKGLSLGEVKLAIDTEVAGFLVDDARIEEIIGKATREVDEALSNGSFIRVFRGKELLRGVYRRVGLDQVGVSYERFAYALATACSGKPEVRAVLDEVFNKLEHVE